MNIWHIHPRIWGKKWGAGDVLGVACDLDTRTIKFSLNGSFAVPFGTAFENIEFVGGLTPGLTANAPFKTTLNWGKDGFKYQAPPGYKSIHDWIEKYRPTAKPVLRRTVSESSTSDVDVVHLMRPCSGIYQISVEEGTEWRPISKPKDKGRLVSEHAKSKYTATIRCARDAKRVVVVVRVRGTMRFGRLPESGTLFIER